MSVDPKKWRRIADHHYSCRIERHGVISVGYHEGAGIREPYWRVWVLTQGVQFVDVGRAPTKREARALAEQYIEDRLSK